VAACSSFTRPFELISHSYTLFHIMSFSSSSDGIEYQVAEALYCTVDQALIMLKAEMEGAPTRWPRLRRRYVNRDHEVAHERLHHDYFASSTSGEALVQHTSHSRTVLLSMHSWFDHSCLHYFTQYDHR
jgi:hypothetical protein